MHSSAPTRRQLRSTLRRAAFALLAIGFAALVAVGCGGDDAGGGSGPGESGIVGGEGPLAWLPADTWLVASADLSAEKLDTAVGTLDRLPIWGLAESFLPASDGKGLRREAFEEIAKGAKERDVTVTAKELEAAFGDRIGLAMTGTDFEAWSNASDSDADSDSDARTVPLAFWIEVDDEDAAAELLRQSTKGEDASSERGGHELWYSKQDDVAFTVADGLVIATPSLDALEELVDIREGDGRSLDEDPEARAIIEVGIGEAIAGVAFQSDPLLEAAPDLLRMAAEQEVAAVDEESGRPLGKQSENRVEDAARLELIASKLGPVLESAAIDGLVADWTAGSLTIDDTGFVSRSAWSNPRELAEPEVGSRELVERMPADAQVVTAMVHDGSGVGRVQDAWAEVRDAYDLDLTELAGQCEPDARVLCSLAAGLGTTLLEDESLAEASEDAGPGTVALVQDIGAALAGLDPDAPAATTAARSMEVATVGEPIDWTPPAELVAELRRAGLVVRHVPGESTNVRVLPGSPIAAMLRDAQAGLAEGGAGAATGFDLSALLTPKGITLESEEADGVRVSGFPQGAPSKVVPALEGDADTLGDSETYGEVAEAAGVPDEVGAYGYVDLRAYVEAILTAVSTESPEVKRALPTVRNNLADAPGVIWWSAREGSGDEQVGVLDVVVPILE